MNNILKFIFDLSLQTSEFADSVKTARVTPLFKNGESTKISNYGPISVLQWFLKISGRIMHDRLKSLNLRSIAEPSGYLISKRSEIV